MGLIFVAVAFITIFLLSLYYSFVNKIGKQSRLDQRVVRRVQGFDHDDSETDLEMQEVCLDDLKVPPRATTRK